MPDKNGLEKQGFNISAGFVIGVLVFLGLLLFGIQNTNKVEVNWLFFDSNVSLWWVILVTAVLTLIAERLIGWGWRRYRRKDND